jgi:hypothetical protein
LFLFCVHSHRERARSTQVGLIPFFHATFNFTACPRGFALVIDADGLKTVALSVNIPVHLFNVGPWGGGEGGMWKKKNSLSLSLPLSLFPLSPSLLLSLFPSLSFFTSLSLFPLSLSLLFLPLSLFFPLSLYLHLPLPLQPSPTRNLRARKEGTHTQ